MPLDFPNPADTTTYTDISSGNTYIYANGSWSLQNILSATRGGTGFNSYNRGDILYGNASGTLSKLTAGTIGQVLSTNGSGSDPSWITVSSSGGGAGTVASSSQYYIASYYSGNGASVSGSSTFTNDTSLGIVSITHNTGSTATTNGAFIVSGGAGIAGSIWSGHHVITDTSSSTGYSTGALLVFGGVGISGNLNVAGTAISLFQGSANQYLVMRSGSNVLRIQTDSASSRVRMFENMTTTGSLGFFGTSGGTLYLGTDSGTQNGPIAIRGNNTSGGGGDQRAATFTLATATSNGTGSGGTMLFQTSTSAIASTSVSNILRTRLRIEGAATGTSHLESIIILGETNSGTAWTSYLRGVDATGENVSAGEIQIQAGRSTGTGVAQGISFYISPSSTTSSTINVASQIGRFSAIGLTIYSSTASISTTTGALIVSGGVGIGGSLNAGAISKFFDHLEIKTQKELRLYNSGDTFYVAFKAGAVSSSSKTFTLPVDYGNDGEFLKTNGSGTLTWAPVTSGVSAVNAGVGISIPSTTGSVTVSIGRPVVLNMASGFTPVGIGTDYNILRVPEGKNNTNTSYNLKKVVLGVGTTSSGTSTIRVEKSAGPHTGTSGFSLASAGSSWNVMSADLSLLSGIAETSWTTFSAGYGTVATGDRVRLNFTAVDSTHANFFVQMLLEEY
jgi:hypothetical protein